MDSPRRRGDTEEGKTRKHRVRIPDRVFLREMLSPAIDQLVAQPPSLCDLFCGTGTLACALTIENSNEQ
jgi:hypothetical protein